MRHSKASHFLSLLAVSILAGCAAPASQLTHLKSSGNEKANLQPYGGQANVYFVLQDKEVLVTEIKGRGQATHIGQLYAQNGQSKNGRYDCVTIQSNSPRYQPCYVTSGEDTPQVRGESIFAKGNLNASDAVSGVLALPFMAVGAVLNAVTLNAEGVENSVKQAKNIGQDYSTDQEAVLMVGQYLDDQIGNVQKTVSQALYSYNPNMLRESNKHLKIKGLMQNNEASQAFSRASTNEQRMAIYRIFENLYGVNTAKEEFTNAVLQSSSLLPAWAQTLTNAGQNTNISLERAKKIPDFAKSENMRDFFNSPEYRYVLKNFTPKISKSEQRDSLQLHLDYGQGITAKISRPAYCRAGNVTTQTEQEQSVASALMNVVKGQWFDKNNQDYQSITYRVTPYSCSASPSDIATLQDWERQLTGSVTASNHFKTSWEYTNKEQTDNQYVSTPMPSSLQVAEYNARYNNSDYSILKQRSNGEILVKCLPQGWEVTIYSQKGEFYTGLVNSSRNFDEVARKACNIY